MPSITLIKYQNNNSGRKCFKYKHLFFILLAQISGIYAITVPSQSRFWNCGTHTATVTPTTVYWNLNKKSNFEK